jgi:magnesium-transporting ATPase (P-type)
VVRAYRQLGHADQAGRFAIALDEGARPEEVRAYSAMLRGLGADEKAARRLSLMPADRELPENVRKATEGRPLSDEWRPWGVYVGIAWAAVVIMTSITMAVAYGFTMAGASDAQSIARWWTLVTGWLLVVTLALTTLWCATSSKWRAALVWTCLTVILGGCVGLVTVALSR